MPATTLLEGALKCGFSNKRTTTRPDILILFAVPDGSSAEENGSAAGEGKMKGNKVNGKRILVAEQLGTKENDA